LGEAKPLAANDEEKPLIEESKEDEASWGTFDS
jgi:hypothetical protein